TNFITIENGTPLPFEEDFQSGQFPPTNWILGNPDAGISWANTSVVGSDGQLTNVAWLNNFDYNAQGELDALQSYTIDLDPTVVGARLNFDVAYAQFNNNFNDRLFVEVSDDCGLTFSSIIYDEEGTDLATTGDQTTLWAPNDSSEWRNESISLQQFAGQTIVIRFVNENGWGNSLYLDNINIELVAPPVAGFVSDLAIVCEGDQIVLSDSSSGDDLVYSWDFGADAVPATASTPGPHTVSYTSGGSKSVSLTVSNSVGSNTSTQTITVEPLPVASWTSATDNGNAFNFTSTSTGSPTSYQWDFGDDSTSTKMNPQHTYLSNGSYAVTLIVTNDCGTDTSVVTLDISTVSLERELSGLSINLTPNPSNGQFEVWIEGDRQGMLELQLLDLKGSALERKEVFFGGGSLATPMGNTQLAEGVYLLRISMNNESVYRRLVIQ
ncbi:MAG: PKD domain-containing protein, partial [Bacteroidota bacterium]